jgi:hypothetical protein
MPAIKPIDSSVEWAKESIALKLNPPTKVLQFGWTTSNDLISGIPQKPILQYENGWKYGVYQWVDYLEDKTDEHLAIPTSGQVNGYLLQTNGSSVFSWNNSRQVPADSATENVLKMTTPSTYGWQAFAPSASVTSTATVVFSQTGTATLGTGADRIVNVKKINDLVTFNANILVASLSASFTGEMRITGLIHFAKYHSAVNITVNGIPGLEFSVQAKIQAGTNYVCLYRYLYGDTENLSTGIPSGTTNIRINVSGSFIST